MDEIVLRGMAKWPNVPAVYGWLSLDRRGQWRIKGEHISNAAVTAFIGRNYAQDDAGRWFFQNGPQRVFVLLGYTPFVYRIVNPDGAPLVLETHVGSGVAFVKGCWLDEAGAVLLLTEHGAGVIHDRDLERLFPCLTDAHGHPLDDDALAGLTAHLQQQKEAPLWLRFGDAGVKIEPIVSADVPGRFGFIARPVQPAGQEECY